MFVPGVMPPPSATPHAFVHEPQCFGSVPRLAHVAPPSVPVHLVVGDWHDDPHLPPEQSWPEAHAFVHDPQCCGSVWRSNCGHDPPSPGVDASVGSVINPFAHA